MPILGMLVRFIKPLGFFILAVIAVWITIKVVSYLSRWILDQLGLEINEIKGWFRGKLPKRKKKKKLELIDFSEEELKILCQKIEEMKKKVE